MGKDDINGLLGDGFYGLSSIERVELLHRRGEFDVFLSALFKEFEAAFAFSSKEDFGGSIEE